MIYPNILFHFEYCLNQYLDTFETLTAYKSTLDSSDITIAQKIYLLELRCTLHTQAINIIAIALPLSSILSKHYFCIILNIIIRTLQ